MNNIEQVNSVPIHLLTLVSMSIDGPGVSNRQPALTIAQLLQTNFRKSKKETPVALFSTFRSKTVINHFFNLGLYLSYDHILEFTKKLSDALMGN